MKVLPFKALIRLLEKLVDLVIKTVAKQAVKNPELEIEAQATFDLEAIFSKESDKDWSVALAIASEIPIEVPADGTLEAGVTSSVEKSGEGTLRIHLEVRATSPMV